MTTVYPVAGHFLQGVPTLPIEADDAVAAELVATGAYTTDEPADPAGVPAPIPMPDGVGLSFYTQEG